MTLSCFAIITQGGFSNIYVFDIVVEWFFLNLVFDVFNCQAVTTLLQRNHSLWQLKQQALLTYWEKFGFDKRGLLLLHSLNICWIQHTLITVIDSIFCVFCAVFVMVTDVEVWVTWNEVSTRYVRKHTRAKLPWSKWQVDTCQPARTASKQASKHELWNANS